MLQIDWFKYSCLWYRISIKMISESDFVITVSKCRIISFFYLSEKYLKTKWFK